MVDKEVERGQTLLETTLDGPPLRSPACPGNLGERPGAVDVLSIALNGEGDSHGDDGRIHGGAPRLQLFIAELLEIFEQDPRSRPRNMILVDQFVVGFYQWITLQIQAHDCQANQSATQEPCKHGITS